MVDDDAPADEADGALADESQPDETEVDESEVDESEVGEERAERREPRTVPAGLFVVAVLVAGLLGVLAVIALSVDGDDGDDSTDSVRAVAGQYAERFLALDHADYDGWLEDMNSIGTAGFGESLGRNEAAIRTLLQETQVSWEGNAIDVFVSSGDDSVGAVVLYDLRVTDADGTRTIPDQYLRLDLVRSTSGWLIERAVSITADGSALAPGTSSGAPSSTTSEPTG